MTSFSGRSTSGIQLHGAVEDTNSPLTAADANPADGNPFTIPAGAIGMIVRPTRAMVSADVMEIHQQSTPVKGEGVQIFGDDGVQFFHIRDSDNLHLSRVAGVVTVSLLVSYVF